MNIIDDEEHEEMESFTLSLINAHPTSVMVHQDKITVTITDNDGKSLFKYICSAKE